MEFTRKALRDELVYRAVPLVPLRLRRQLLFHHSHGVFFSRSPQTFSEKIQWRLLYDRRPIIRVGGDKIEMKKFARSVSDIAIPETFWHGVDLKSVLDVDFGDHWFLKPISGSGYSVAGAGTLRASGIDLTEVSKWRFDKAARAGVWAYQVGRPGYLIEQAVPSSSGRSPDDYKFWVFDGQVKLIYTCNPREDSGHSHRFYGRDWEALDISRPHLALADVVEPPRSLEKMVTYAELLGSEYDFVRIDLYDGLDEVYFGEISPFPADGLNRFSPESADALIGSYWTLPDLQSRLGR